MQVNLSSDDVAKIKTSIAAFWPDIDLDKVACAQRMQGSPVEGEGDASLPPGNLFDETMLHVFALMETDSLIDFKRSQFYARVADEIKPSVELHRNDMDAIRMLPFFGEMRRVAKEKSCDVLTIV